MSCKTCDRMQEYAEMDIEGIIDEQLSLEINLADSDTIANRLSICQECPFLKEHTCLQCGCFVRLRASMVIKKCPMTYW